MKKYGLVIFLISFALLVFFGCSKKGEESPSGSTKEESQKIEYYTCSMHPWVHEDKPGRCPACGMPLVPVYSQAEEVHEHAPTPETAPSPPQAPLPEAKKERKILFWTDPMIPGYKSDKPGKSPMGMDLVPVYEEQTAGGSPPGGGPASAGAESQATKMTDRATVRLSPEKQQLIGVKTEAVGRHRLMRRIQAAGRVAFDPDLMVAQKEYLMALKTSGGELASLQNALVRASKQKLLLLGMSEVQIQDLARKGKAQTSLIVPEEGESVWIYGSLFESDLPWVKVGDPVKIELPGSPETREAQVLSIDPTIDPMTRTTQARVRVSNVGMVFKPNMFIKMIIEAEAGDVLAIPEGALLSTGSREIAFVDQGNGRFEPREVKIGRRGTGFVEVISGVSEGEKVVTSANFLIDSESRLKAAISGMGGHQH